ncbi:poly(A) RNA polymerase, mitochondrial [Prorops nasuta]|uniref:poly(A) RNA polymerase, mitochondrial n=1 Tax=Prorops nasuta TaxID=863751 RepID=UPI0034CDC205
MALFCWAKTNIILPINYNVFKLNSEKVNICWKCYFYLQSKRLLSSKITDNKKKLSNGNPKFSSLKNIVKERRSEASKSMIVHVNSIHSYLDLYNYCNSFGDVLGMHHFSMEQKHYILVEFHNASALNFALSKSIFQENVIPVKSPVLWFRKDTRKFVSGNVSSVPLIIENGTLVPHDSTICRGLIKQSSVSEQMIYLYEILKLNDLEKRLRFLIAYQIEQIVSGIFNNVSVKPFGSTISGFGLRNCDLDLALQFQKPLKDKYNNRLVFSGKMIKEGRVQVQDFLLVMADIMQHFMPGIKNVKKTLFARVPIIQFEYSYTCVDCDLSMTNMTALYMSELLYILGEIDSRVRPLVFTVRKWAEKQDLTKQLTPSARITNYSLTLLVLFFLQQKYILPSIDYLKRSAEEKDYVLVDDCVDCTFLRDITKLPPMYKDNQNDSDKKTLEDLLLEFFEFYSTFDFHNKAISLNKGETIKKPDNWPMYICNPLERSLNVTKNVNQAEVARLQQFSQNALSNFKNNKLSKSWGIAQLLNFNDCSNLDHSTDAIDIQDLFDEGNKKNSKTKNIVK